MTCQNCGHTVLDGSTYCRMCGTKIQAASTAPATTCSACGARLENGQAFCPQCGSQKPADTQRPRNSAVTFKPLNSAGVDRSLKTAKVYAYFSFIPFYGVFAMISTYAMLKRTQKNEYFEARHQKEYEGALKLIKIALAVQGGIVFLAVAASM